MKFWGADQKACKRACVEDFTFHDLRRTFGTRLLESGVDIITIQKLYGHSSVLVTQKYLHPKDETSKEAVEFLCKNTGILTHHRHTEQDKQIPEFPTYEFSVN
ncbi:tyrosine-type recombinase/integrase [Acidobacteriota bacterium]